MPSYVGPTLFRYLFGPHRLRLSYRGVKRQRLAAEAGVEHASYVCHSLLDEPDLHRPTVNLQILIYPARFDPML